MRLFSSGSTNPKGKQIVKPSFVSFFGLKFKYSKAKGLSFEGEIQLYKLIRYGIILLGCTLLIIKVKIIIVNQ